MRADTSTYPSFSSAKDTWCTSSLSIVNLMDLSGIGCVGKPVLDALRVLLAAGRFTLLIRSRNARASVR